MGVNHSYLLYFRKEDLWHAIDGLLTMAEPHQPPTRILFPDGERLVPLDSWTMQGREIHHDDPEFSFATVLKFDWDEAIDDWLSRIGHTDDPDRAPPDPDEEEQASIGYIYLTIYTDLSKRFDLAGPSENVVLFEFDTTGSRMSMLFSGSTSMRAAFIRLLENYRGLCGMFNWESSEPEVFWLKGRHLCEYLGDTDPLPDAIEAWLQSQP